MSSGIDHGEAHHDDNNVTDNVTDSVTDSATAFNVLTDDFIFNFIKDMYQGVDVDQTIIKFHAISAALRQVVNNRWLTESERKCITVSIAKFKVYIAEEKRNAYFINNQIKITIFTAYSL